MFDKGLGNFTAKAIDVKVSHIWSHYEVGPFSREGTMWNPPSRLY